MNVFFLVLVLWVHVEEQPPKVVHMFNQEDKCQLAAMKLNERPEVNTEEAKEAGAEFICLKFIPNSY